MPQILLTGQLKEKPTYRVLCLYSSFVMPVTVGLCQANRKAKPSEEGHTTAPKKGNALHVSGCTNISTESKNLEAWTFCGLRKHILGGANLFRLSKYFLGGTNLFGLCQHFLGDMNLFGFAPTFFWSANLFLQRKHFHKLYLCYFKIVL